MSHVSALDGTQASRHIFANLLSLPYELIQCILNFEPWTYTPTSEHPDESSTDEELIFHTRDSMPLRLTNIYRTILGLSSADDWLDLTLSRHSYRLSRKHGGISSAVAQTIRRMNARLGRLHWVKADLSVFPELDEDSHAKDPSAVERPLKQISSVPSMPQYYAHVNSEEDLYFCEELKHARAMRGSENTWSPATALVAYKPVPILKLTAMDLSSRMKSTNHAEQITALLVATLTTLLQCHSSLLQNLERLERDTPIPSIETYESKDFATPRTSPYPDRLRSLSGSTVVDVFAHEDTLSFSAVSTVYNSEASIKRVGWDGREEEVASPKRPKLSQYKQVSSGRVATLMDRFEKFHL